MPDISRHTFERSETASFHCFKAGSMNISVGFPTLNDIRNSLGEMGTFLESTDHVLAEYIQTQKMESVEYLARELGHDLRNGLMAVAAKLFQMQRALPGDEIQRRVEDIQSVLRNLEEMISWLQSLGQDDHMQEDFVFLDLVRETPKAIRHIESLTGGRPDSARAVTERLSGLHEIYRDLKPEIQPPLPKARRDWATPSPLPATVSTMQSPIR